MRLALTIIAIKLVPQAVGLILIAMAVAGAVSYAAPNPNEEMPAIRPEIAKDERKPIERCLEAVTVYRFMVEPGGGMRQVAKVTVWKAC